MRLRVESQIGYKSMKYLQRIVVTDEFMDMEFNFFVAFFSVISLWLFFLL